MNTFSMLMCFSTFMNNYCIYSLLTGNQFLSIQIFQFCYIECIIFVYDNNSNSYSCHRTLMEVFRHMNFHVPTIGWRYSLGFVYFVDFSSNSYVMYYYLGDWDCRRLWRINQSNAFYSVVMVA